ncbi:hypothetical protein [Bacillus cereus group sp. MG11]|uniref:hypothetical protein n=1 Tax=Bacillus cereus group sp. MG11 TaxID=3040248 RepID=UPI003390839D
MKTEFLIDENIDRLLNRLGKVKEEHKLNFERIENIVFVTNELTGQNIRVYVWGSEELLDIESATENRNGLIITRRNGFYEVFSNEVRNQLDLVVRSEKLLYKVNQPKHMVNWIVKQFQDKDFEKKFGVK